jgi:hypothetical protein
MLWLVRHFYVGKPVKGVAMGRLTSEQKTLTEGMKLLVELYHLLESMQNEAWFSELAIQSLPNDVVSKMAAFFEVAVPNFSPALFFPARGLFRFRTRRTSIRVNLKRYLTDFMDLMCAVSRDYLSGKLKDCLSVRKVIYETSGPPGTRPSKLLTKRSQRSLQGRRGKEIFKIIAAPLKNASKSSLKSYTERMESDLNAPPAFYERFEIDLNSRSEIYSALQTYDLPLDPNIDSLIISPKDGEATSFAGVVLYFLVKYHLVFGSFERLKACNFCGSLFLERKLGAREFCSSLCRKQYHDALQPREKRLCRERQNFWISARVSSGRAYHVYQDDCEMCNDYAKSGLCPVLKRKNKDTLQRLKPAAKKKRRKSLFAAH